jgi:uncharacterized protein
MSKLTRFFYPEQGAQAEPLSPDAAVPVAKTERISIIDSLRGVALLGILLMNIPYFGLPYLIADSLDILDEYSGPNYYTWWVINGVFEGTMRALFSMLFGAGSLLLLNRLEKKHMGTYPADIYYRRLIWLLVFGLINAFIFLWAGDILYTYAICGLFIFPFRNLKPKHLLILGLAVMLTATLKMTLNMHEKRDARVKGDEAIALAKQNKPLTEEQKEIKEKREAALKKSSPENEEKEVQKEIREVTKGYFSIMKYYKDINVKIQSSEFYNFYFWDAIAFFFIGMALFKWGVLTGQKPVSFYVWMAIICYIPGFTLNILMLRARVVTRFDDSMLADQLFINFYQEKRLLLALGHLGLLMTLYKLKIMDWFFRLMAAVGQMAFTNYLMQSIICTFIFFGYGLSWFGTLQRYQLYYVVAGVWIFQIIFSNIWLRYYRFGPFEWLWRSLTYWKRQPMRRIG